MIHDKVAMEAIRTLKRLGYSADEVERAMRAVAGTAPMSLTPDMSTQEEKIR